jgi:RHS repeat-associated protein
MYGRSHTSIEQINTSTGTASYLHHDQAGSTRLITGSTGSGQCTYTAYGTPTCEGSAATPLGFDAQYTSSDTGLIYLRNRVYDPTTAQFLTVDPLKAITGERYSYAGDNPVNSGDPSGLSNWNPRSLRRVVLVVERVALGRPAPLRGHRRVRSELGPHLLAHPLDVLLSKTSEA